MNVATPKEESSNEMKFVVSVRCILIDIWITR